MTSYHCNVYTYEFRAYRSRQTLNPALTDYNYSDYSDYSDYGDYSYRDSDLLARVVKAVRARRVRSRDPGNLLTASVQRDFQFPSELVASLGQLESLPPSLPGLNSLVERLQPRVVD